MRDSVKIIIACIVCLGVVGAAGIYVYFSRNQKQKDRKVVTRPYGDVVQWKYEDEDDTKWRELMNLDVLKVDGEAPALRVEDGYIQYEKSEGEWVNLIPLDSLAGAAGSEGLQGAQGEQGTQGLQGPKGDKGEDGRPVELRASNGYVQWRYANESDWKNLIAVAALSGSNGQDGRSVEVRNNGTAIVWRYEGESDAAWRPIMALAALRGEIGPTGEPGVSGEPGISGAPGEPGPAGADGTPGNDGRPVQVDIVDGSIQWRYEGDETWTPLVSVESLTGAKGEDGADAKDIELRQSEDGLTVEWKYTSEDDTQWRPLITLKNGVNGTDGKDGKDGREVEITVRPYKAAVTPNEELGITAAPEQKEAIVWRYTTGDDTSYKVLIEKDKLMGAQGPQGETGNLLGDLELRVTTVPVLDGNGDPVMEDDGLTPKTEEQIQWKSSSAGDDAWTKLCLLSDLGAQLLEEKDDPITLTAPDTIDLDSGKKYLVTMSLSGTNDTDNDFTITLSCGSNKVVGTWKAATPGDDSDPDNLIPGIGFSATYSTSFVVSGQSSITFDLDPEAVDSLGVGVLINVVEI
ncbi:MAG: collagen-like protein [Clostridiales bacterium]|nr:collagen-like protein [Clostridiales bacterium]